MVTDTRIPIANIFFMLAYAWNIEPTWERKVVDKEDYDSLWELLARLLVESTNDLFKRGLARDYVVKEETFPGVKGKINIGRTFRTGAWHNAKAVCSFDEFQADIIINQVIKATVYRMLRSSGHNLENSTKSNLKQLLQRFGEVSLIDNEILRKIDSINLQRHQLHYKFPLNLSKFILMNTVFNEEEGKYGFLDFERSHQKMSTLFEHFIFNYYKKHQKNWKVKRENIQWHYEEGGIGVDHLPMMQTDITLERFDRKLIIDAKFYQEPMKSRVPGSPKKFASTNLYQLHAYLSNLAKSDKHPCNYKAEGMLLYPVLKPIKRLDANMLGHRIRIESIDLNQNWRDISEDLNKLLDV